MVPTRRGVATQKQASHEGRKVLLVQPLNLDGSDRGDTVVALDAVDAGVGRPLSPIDMAVIGFIDHMTLFPGGRRTPALLPDQHRYDHRSQRELRSLGHLVPEIRNVARQPRALRGVGIEVGMLPHHLHPRSNPHALADDDEQHQQRHRQRKFAEVRTE